MESVKIYPTSEDEGEWVSRAVVGLGPTQRLHRDAMDVNLKMQISFSYCMNVRPLEPV